jgi:hypothetical protein
MSLGTFLKAISVLDVSTPGKICAIGKHRLLQSQEQWVCVLAQNVTLLKRESLHFPCFMRCFPSYLQAYGF